MNIEEHLIIDNEQYFKEPIQEIYVLKRSNEEMLKNRWGSVVFPNIPSCNEFLACCGELIKEGYKIALIFKDNPSESEIEKITNAVYNTIPVMYLVQFFTVSEDVFKKTISNNPFLRPVYNDNK